MALFPPHRNRSITWHRFKIFLLSRRHQPNIMCVHPTQCSRCFLLTYSTKSRHLYRAYLVREREMGMPSTEPAVLVQAKLLQRTEGGVEEGTSRREEGMYACIDKENRGTIYYIYTSLYAHSRAQSHTHAQAKRHIDTRRPSRQGTSIGSARHPFAHCRTRDQVEHHDPEVSLNAD